MSARIGLIWPQTGGVWTAGNLYFENLLTSIDLAGKTRAVTVLESEGGSFRRVAANHPGVGVTTTPTAKEPTTKAGLALRILRRQFKMPDRAWDAAVAQSGADVLFGDVDLRSRSTVPWVGWIPDFQHVHYPEFFSDAQLAERDDVYSRLARRATLVLLSSEDALADFSRFAPDMAHKGRVAPFVSLFPEEFITADATETVSKYRITGPFVVVPNQWWQHKNHEVAIRAAALLAARGREVTWVVTGATADYRSDAHISRLFQLISELGVRDRMVILGALPRFEQVRLLRAAECIVQPSLFEGWSTVVEDAKTLGQRLITSDIPIHREQDPPATLFFDPRSPDELADQVEAMLDGAFERPNEAAARAASLERARGFGERFVEICDEAGRSGDGRG